MKKVAISLSILMFTAVGMTAQENVDVKKETVTKKVHVSDKYSDDVQVIEEVEEEIEVIEVEENNQTNQDTKRLSNKNDQKNIVKSESKKKNEFCQSKRSQYFNIETVFYFRLSSIVEVYSKNLPMLWCVASGIVMNVSCFFGTVSANFFPDLKLTILSFVP